MTDGELVKAKEGSFEDNYEKKQQQEEEKFKEEQGKKESETQSYAYTPKDILDKYRPMIIRKEKIFLKDGEAQVNNHDQEKYTPENYSEDIVLQIAPKDAVILEFEDTPEKNKRYIVEIEEACRILNLQYCITSHNGKSDYVRVYNIKNIPVNEDNKKAKDLLISTILPAGAKEQLDTTNIGWTLSPVIGHPHWKPKYNGAKHEIIRGIHPIDQKNTYPLELLKKIQKAKKQQKATSMEILQNNQWVNDFLINYCCTHLLPKGSRHYIIEKNLSALIYHRTDADEIIEKYLKAQGRITNTLRTWINAISNGNYTEVSVLELKRYIEENNILYTIPIQKTTTDETINIELTKEDIKILSDPKLLLNLVLEIQKQGVVGEEHSILVIINKAVLRLVKNHNPTSSNMLISDTTGAGKDKIVKITLKVMIPKKDLIHRTRFSDKALEYYFMGKEDNFTFDGKVIYLEDPEEELLKSQAFRVLTSGQNKVSVVKDQELLELEVKGKPVIIVTSMNATIDEEGGRRWDGIKIDTSENLTKKVIEKKLINAEGMENKPMPPLVKAIKTLKPYEVVIPYAQKLLPYFTEKPTLIMRTQIDKLLDYIKASAVLHQYQRQKDNQGRIIADGFDYEYAKFMFTALGDAEGGVLNPVERKLIEILKKSKNPLSFSEVVKEGFTRSKDWLYKHEEELISKGIIKEIEEYVDKANKNITKMYCSFGYSAIKFPESSVLFGFINDFQNQNKEGFIGFIGFCNIEREINNNRIKCGLKPVFDDLDEKILQVPLNFTKNHEDHEKLSVSGFILPNKTIQNLSVDPLEKSHSEGKKHDEVDDFLEFKEYCKRLTKDRGYVPLAALYDNFLPSMVDQAIASGLLAKLEGFDNRYYWISGKEGE